MDDFRKYATKHLGMNGMVLDDVIKSQAGYLNPYILEERQLNVTQLDVFSRLMMDRIIFLGTQVDDYTANTLQAQLLYLDSVDPGKDISIYINSPGGSVYAGLGIYDTMQFISSDVATICTGMAASMAAVLLVAGAEGMFAICLSEKILYFCRKQTEQLMKILHTADWHLGQTFYEYDRREEHFHFLEWLKQQIKQHEIDVLLIAGDVFDSPNPSAESQRVYYRFLREVTSENPSLQIVIIAGNHDSAARLEAPNPLLEDMNIIVRGTVRRNAEGDIDLQHLIVPLYTEGKVTAYCLAVPYLRQGDYPSAENYSKGVQQLYEQLFNKVKEKGKPVVAMGHLQATGSEISEDDRSERTVIGGLECVSPDAFDEAITYTALGHLHRSQRVSHRDNVRYSGTPMPMSFAERNNTSGVVMITIDAEGTDINKLAFEPLAGLVSIPPQARPLEEVLQAIGELPDGDATLRSPYLEIKILMTEPEPSYKYKIEEALKGKAVRLARIAAMLPQKKASGISATSYEELQTIRPLDMALDVFKRKYGGTEMPDTMKQLLESVIKEAGI